MRVVKGVRDTMEMYAIGRPTIQLLPRATRAGRRPSRTSSSPTGCGSRATTGSWPAARSPWTAATSPPAPTRSASTPVPAATAALVGGRPVLRGLGADSFSITGNRIDLKLDGQGAHLSAREGQRQGGQQGVGAGRGHHRARREPPQAGADPRLGRQSPALGDLDQLRDEGGLAGARHAGPAAPGGARLRQGLARRRRSTSRRKDRDWMRGDTVVARFAARGFRRRPTRRC